MRSISLSIIVMSLFLSWTLAEAAPMTSADYTLSDSATTNGGMTSSSTSYQLRGMVRNEDGSTGLGTLYAVHSGVLPLSQSSTSAITGDITGNGIVDISDAYKILEIAVGRAQPTASNLKVADVAPLLSGKISQDGVIDVSDVVVTLRKIVGLVSW